jgi:hypothetical protein
MNLYENNREKEKKYKVKSVSKPKIDEDTSQYNLTKEEVAESVINSLNDAQKFLRGELELRPLDELLDELDRYVEEERKNGRC